MQTAEWNLRNKQGATGDNQVVPEAPVQLGKDIKESNSNKLRTRYYKE